MKKYVCNENDIEKLVNMLTNKEFESFHHAYRFVERLSNKYEKIMYVTNPTRNMVSFAMEQGYDKDFKIPMYGVNDFIVATMRVSFELVFVKNKFTLLECDRILIYKMKEVKLRNDKLIITNEYAYNRSALLNKEKNNMLDIKKALENELVSKHITRQIINSSYSKFSQLTNLLIKFSNDSDKFVRFLNSYLKITPRGEIKWDGKY